jgi:F-type H+-transporting ATPase subunit gamma
VKATQKITRAMQMVAASKLRRAQAAAEAARPYATRMQAVLADLAASVAGRADAPRLLAGTGADDTHLLVVCTAERGLCGAFNSSIARLARERVLRLQGEGKTVKILCVGRKGHDILRRLFDTLIVGLIEMRGVRRLAFADADAVGKRVLELFDDGQFDVATLFYAEFKSVIAQVPTARQLIPAEVGEAGREAGNGAIHEYEPDEEAILADLLPRNLSVQIFRALLENAASEMGAKMAAMDNATRNAGDMIEQLTLHYNRTRQAQITRELIEIISGAEAL